MRGYRGRKSQRHLLNISMSAQPAFPIDPVCKSVVATSGSVFGGANLEVFATYATYLQLINQSAGNCTVQFNASSGTNFTLNGNTTLTFPVNAANFLSVDFQPVTSGVTVQMYAGVLT